MLKTGFAITAAALLLMAGASAADATTLTTTYSGVVSSGSDPLGVFGAMGADLTGEAFSVRYTVNDATPGDTQFFGSLYSYVTGNGVADPVTAVVRIGGGSLNIAANSTGFAYESAEPGTPIWEIEDLANDGVYSARLYIVSYTHPFTAIDYRSLVSYSVSTGDAVGCDPTYSYESIVGPGLSACFDITHVTTTVGSAPEPSTWTMVLIGMGTIGAAMRMSRRKSGVGLAAA
jgi:hypothetical protein